MLPDFGLLNYIQDRSQGCRHVTLIDPGKQSAEIATKRAITAIEAGSNMIFIGGSTDTPNEVVHETCKSIQEALELQIFAASQDPSSDEDMGIQTTSPYHEGGFDPSSDLSEEDDPDEAMSNSFSFS